MEKLWKKLINKETILYLVFGILTTAINIAVCVLLSDILKWDIYLSNTIAWILSVIFAFVTNKIFVFNSKSTDKKVLLKETVFFLIARLISLGFDMLVVWLMADLWGINVWIVKIISNIIVIIMNYVFSKLFIFNNKQHTKQK